MKTIVTPLSDIPAPLRGLWKLQYRPLEVELEKAFRDPSVEHPANATEQLAKYRKAHFTAKMSFLDRLYAKHFAS